MNLPMSVSVNKAETISLGQDKGLYLDHLVNSHLSCMKTHTLAEQEQAALMTRVDDKYVIKLKDVPVLLKAIRNDYSVLTESGIQLFSYQTRYFDTQDMQCYSHHHNGKGNRFKLRIRHYDDTQATFVECKLKSNTGRTTKLRRAHMGSFSLASASDFLFQTLSRASDTFHPVLDVHYYRITLMNRTCDQRITIDLNLTYQNLESDVISAFQNTAVIEIKKKRQSDHTAVNRVLSKLRYQPRDFSKYCMGCVLTQVAGIKYNRFKSNVLYLNKLEKLEC